MRIAILTNSLKQTGGAGRIAALQKAMLETYGHTVEAWECAPKWIALPGFLRAFFHLVDLLPNPSMVNGVLGWKPDVLITHNLTGCGWGSGKAVQSHNGIRWIHVLHDVQMFEPSGRLVDENNISLWQRFWSALRALSFGKPDLVVSPTTWLVEQHQRRGLLLDCQTQVLPNPAPSPEFAARMPQDPLQMMIVGTSKEKGFDFACHLLDKLSFSARLHAVNPGISPNALVTVHGHLTAEGVRDLMLACDVLLVPSQIAENQPTVILEAAAVGLPVIASDLGGIRETLDGAGILCDAHDVDVWAQALETFRDSGAYADLAARMFELARKHDAESYAEQLDQLISKR